MSFPSLGQECAVCDQSMRYGTCPSRKRDGDCVIHLYDGHRQWVCSEDDVRLLEDLVHRVRAEFLEMPGLRLTAPQARRFWGLDEELCAAILSALVNVRFLRRTRDGAFARHDGASV